MILTTTFSESQIFSSEIINIFCNQIFTVLANRLDLKNVKENLVLDGAAAKLIQDIDVPISKIEFSTNKIEILELVKSCESIVGYDSISIDQYLVLFNVSGYFIQFNWKETPLTPIEIKGIFVENYLKS